LRKIRYLPFWDAMKSTASGAKWDLCPSGMQCRVHHTQTGSNSSTIAADSSNGVTNTRCCRCSCMRS
jgi:hypothetical protein